MVEETCSIPILILEIERAVLKTPPPENEADVDAWWLDFIQNTKLQKRYFHETDKRVVRITLQLTPLLGETVSLWKKMIAPIVTEVGKILLENVG